MTDPCREAFEKWADSEGFDLSTHFFDEGEPFESSDTLLAFKIFQAAWNADRWILCAERLPTLDEEVLMLALISADDDTLPIRLLGAYTEDGWYTGDCEVSNVIAWSKLPAIPTTEAKQ